MSFMLENKLQITQNEIIGEEEVIISNCYVEPMRERPLIMRQRWGLHVWRRNETEKSNTVMKYVIIKEQ